MKSAEEQDTFRTAVQSVLMLIVALMVWPDVGETQEPTDDVDAEVEALREEVAEDSLALAMIEKNAADNSLALGNVQGALEGYGSACDSDLHEACVALAEMHATLDHGREIFDFPKALELLEAACRAGHLHACGRWADYNFEGVDNVEPEHYALFLHVCDLGNGEGCYFASISAEHGAGTGTEKDAQLARAHAKRGCDLGYARPCIRLGNLYVMGIGGEKDYDGATEYFTRACDLGDETTCKMLGR